MTEPTMLKMRHTGTPNVGGGEGAMWEDRGLSYTLSTSQDQTMFVPSDDEYEVRRLTPTECERLQGFPDGHTDLTGCDADAILQLLPQWRDADEVGRRKVERKVRKWCEETPDGPRYKACGNSMAVPVMRMLAERIQRVDNILTELPNEKET